VNGSQQIPLVVLIGQATASYGEVFAGVLKDIGRAYLIGETTDGNVETLWGYDLMTVRGFGWHTSLSVPSITRMKIGRRPGSFQTKLLLLDGTNIRLVMIR